MLHATVLPFSIQVKEGAEQQTYDAHFSGCKH